jgi:hypothetical protein
MVTERELPFGNTQIKEVTIAEVSSTNLQKWASENGGSVSICVRTNSGPNDRGGYIFHYKGSDDGVILEYFPFNDEDYTVLNDYNELNRLVNHVIGEEWDEEMYKRSIEISTRIEE